MILNLHKGDFKFVQERFLTINRKHQIALPAPQIYAIYL